MVDKEYEQILIQIRTWGFKDGDDFIRKNMNKLTEEQIRLLDMIGFEFKEK